LSQISNQVTLIKIDYLSFLMKLIEFSHKAGDWEINNLVLGDVNLIVGENATGKSKTLDAILNFQKLIIKKFDFIYEKKYWWRVCCLTDNNTKIEYEIRINDKTIKAETLKVNGKTLIKRKIDNCNIFSVKESKFISISPPKKELVINVRRDIQEFPEFEHILRWADFSKNYNFFKFDNIEDETGIARFFTFLNGKQQLKVISICKKVGFNFMEIEPEHAGYDSLVLRFKEPDVKYRISFSNLSQGMKRAIGLIIDLELRVNSVPDIKETLIIDDLGEGLDYKKATNLGKYIFKRCKEAGIQLIATSNDNFLMDVIDLEHWNILTRKGSKVSAINKTTHPKIFEDFMFTGLSNFSLLTSDYLNRKLKELETV